MNRFVALDTAFELAAAVAPHLQTPRLGARDLADQLRRSTASVASNLAEGNRRIGKDRYQLFRTAEGSAAEAHAQLRLAAIFGILSEQTLAPIFALADRTTALCFGLSRDALKGYRQRE